MTVDLSSFACVSGHWGAGGNCSTPSGATFSLPITLNIYKASTDGVNPGDLITSLTQNFDVSYRPSASAKCSGGDWYSSGTKSCFNGLADNVTFNFAGVTLPDQVVYGIAYNTSHHGYNAIGESACNATAAGCPYDSLNIALTQDPTDVSAGSDTVQGTIWQNSTFAGFYCDGGYAGTGTFRLDSPNTASCWGVNSPYDVAPFYVPAVQFKASK